MTAEQAILLQSLEALPALAQSLKALPAWLQSLELMQQHLTETHQLVKVVYDRHDIEWRSKCGGSQREAEEQALKEAAGQLWFEVKAKEEQLAQHLWEELQRGVKAGAIWVAPPRPPRQPKTVRQLLKEQGTRHKGQGTRFKGQGTLNLEPFLES